MIKIGDKIKFIYMQDEIRAELIDKNNIKILKDNQHWREGQIASIGSLPSFVSTYNPKVIGKITLKDFFE
jgi:hypothetical protein